MNTTSFPRALTALLLAGLVASSAGCEIFSFLAALGGQAVEAEYKLADRPTLVMVDDPDNLLGHSSLAGLMAQTVGRKLQQAEVLTEETRLVSQQELHDLAQQLGEDYRLTQTVQVGRLLDAEQVIHVRVRSVDLTRAPGVYQPKMTVEVKVLDAAESKRLFPQSLEFDEQWNNQGYMLSTQTPVRTPEMTDNGIRANLTRELAVHTAVHIAQLFYKHKRPEPGSTLN